ncbi:MAG: TfoX/Sxy family protein [Pseudomonadota bacterium]
MTKLDNPFHTYVEDLFANLGRIRIRKMFGGAGVYSGEDMFALIDKDRVYVKSDDALKESLQSEGGTPFEWTNPSTGKTIKMSYVSLPVNALDDRDEASAWGRKALDVAIQARRAKVKSPRRMTF